MEEEEEAVSPPADGHPAEAPYEEEQEDVEEEKELEEPGPELEAPLEDVSGEPVESGTRLTTQGLPYALFLNNSALSQYFLWDKTSASWFNMMWLSVLF